MADQENANSKLPEVIWQRARNWFKGLSGRTPELEPEINPEDITAPCCSPSVHIAYRGKSDDRMYVTYNRTWQEVRFFQPVGLRVFCAECRRRVL